MPTANKDGDADGARTLGADNQPGDFPVRVTVADVSEEQDGSHLREAYLSLVLSEADSVTVEAAPGPDGPPPPGQYFTVEVGQIER